MNISYHNGPNICTSTDTTGNFDLILSTFLPESIPCQKQILQEPVDVQVKALNPFQTAAKENILVYNEYKKCMPHAEGLVIVSK